ncbi:MAG TPA: FemAB family XrtA/PEP-CTERM system-associated protein [Terriglobia bacterium]|nr:FemAB family XrtA/PEP-CTERM system-associated protein [Terriglobia bacterium]
MRVETCEDGSLWDAYVEASPYACNYHRWVWKQVINETCGHRPYYLAAVNEDALQGVLPLFLIKSRTFGNSLVSMPFFSYGGVLAGTEEARDALLAEAVALGRELRVRHVQLRQGTPCAAGWQEATRKVTMLVDLPATTDELWKGLSTGMRNKIRSARKRGLTSDCGGVERLDTFYDIFATNMRDLGTPVYPRSWFDSICRHNPDTVKVLTVWDEGQPVAAGLISLFRETAEWPWSATAASARRKYGAVFLYWSLLEWAMQNGYRCVDFGRCTPGSGNWEFKRHWGCVEKPLNWWCWLAPGERAPDLHADNPRYRLAVRIWQHLPLGVANWLGPRVARSIP